MLPAHLALDHLYKMPPAGCNAQLPVGLRRHVRPWIPHYLDPDSSAYCDPDSQDSITAHNPKPVHLATKPGSGLDELVRGSTHYS